MSRVSDVLDRVLSTAGPAYGSVAGMLAQRRVSPAAVERAASLFRRAADQLDELVKEITKSGDST